MSTAATPVPGSAASAMHIVGDVEIAAGLVVLLTPRWAAAYGIVAAAMIEGAANVERLAA
jgi:hypothetical protein